MGKIVIKNIQHTPLENNENEKSVLALIQANYIDWMHACGAKGRCTTCKMIIVSGLENLSGHSEFEKKVAKQGKLKENERLACQCKLEQNDLVIAVPEENKLPHMNYLSD